jgi:hypothetical protein
VKYALWRAASVSRLLGPPASSYVMPRRALYYDLERCGDFIDFSDQSVFPARSSRPAGTAGTAFGSVDIRVLKRVPSRRRAPVVERDAGPDVVDFEPSTSRVSSAAASFLF